MSASQICRLIVLLVAATAVLSIAFAGCGNTRVGGPCLYTYTYGNAIIHYVSDPGPLDSANALTRLEVRFDFHPDDPNARDRYQFPHNDDFNRRFTLHNGYDPCYLWLEAAGVTDSSTHRCARMEIVGGTCSPVVFEFTALDLASAYDSCR
jgi:hypothetical protein